MNSVVLNRKQIFVMFQYMEQYKDVKTFVVDAKPENTNLRFSLKEHDMFVSLSLGPTEKNYKFQIEKFRDNP